jgi:hypothetical protein
MTSNRDTAQSALDVFLICTLVAYAAYFVRAADRIIITGMYYTTSRTENSNFFPGLCFYCTTCERSKAFCKLILRDVAG